MTREELLEQVNKKFDTTKCKALSSRTINEELDEVLGDIGDDESNNDKIVTRLANRLKRIDGNLHANVADEVKKYGERGTKEKDGKEADETAPAAGTSVNEALLARIEKLEREAKERNEREVRNGIVSAVKEGLKAKFAGANMEMNGFFADIAMEKLEIGENPDVQELVKKAESIYTSDMKKAGFTPETAPRRGSSEQGREERIDEHLWDDIAAMKNR